MDQSTLFKSLGDVASHINASSDLDATLGHLLEAVCMGAPWTAGGIMSVDTASGYAEVVARHDPDYPGLNLENRWLLSESPSLVALARNEAVVIEDPKISEQFPGYRREAIELGYGTVIILPMEYRSAEGYRNVLSVRSRQVVTVGEPDLAFLKFVVQLGDIAMSRARSLAEEQAFGERLRQALDAHASLLDQVLSNGSVEAVAAKAVSMLPNPFVIVDLTARRVLAERSPTPETIDDERWRAAASGPDASQFLEYAGRQMPGGRFDTFDLALTVSGQVLRLPALFCPLHVDGVRVGALIAFSRSADFSDLDHLLLDSARFGLAVQMMRGFVANAAEARSQEDLFGDILDENARISEAVVERARRLGIDLSQPAGIARFSLSKDEMLAGPQVEEALHRLRNTLRRNGLAAVTVRRGASLVIWRPTAKRDQVLPAPLAQQLLQELKAVFAETLVLVQSRICHAASDYPAAWRESGRLLGLARRFGRCGMVSAQDFGSFPVLMSAVDNAEMRAFVETLVGTVVRHDREHASAYIETLASFLENGGRAQPTADALGLHVTTLRYRLSRLRDLFGIAMETPEQRFALQLALQFQKILTPDQPPGAEGAAEILGNRSSH